MNRPRPCDGADEALRLLGSAVEQSRVSLLITAAELDHPGPRTDPAVRARLRRNLEHGEEFSGEAINYRKDGSDYVQEWQIVLTVRSGDPGRGAPFVLEFPIHPPPLAHEKSHR